MVRLQGQLHIEKLRGSIQTILSRHEALHLRFDPDGEYQRKTTPENIDIPIRDLSAFTDKVQSEKLQALFAEIGSNTFDLANGPLVCIQVVQMANDDHIVLFSCHHIVCDGWSWNQMLQEIGQVYSARIAESPYTLQKSFNYSNYVMAEMQRQTSESVANSYAYWLEQFADVPPTLELPTDRPRPALKSFKGATVTHYFQSELYSGLKQTAAEERASLFSLLFASFNLLLGRLSSQDDVVMTVPSAGQLMTGQSALIGHCVNLLPIRTRLDMQQPFSDFLSATTTKILDAYENQDCTLGGIVNRLELPRNPSRIPLAEVNFNVDRDDAGVQFGDLQTAIAQTPKQAVVFDIFFNINEASTGLMVDCDYNADLYDQATIERWIAQYEALLQSIIANPEQTLANLSILSQEERNRLLVDWNDTARNYPSDKCMHELFAAQVAQTPNDVAVIFGDKTYTYRELDERANQLAHYLRSLGAGPEDLVGIYVERSAEMVVAFLGTFKAGAAYVPMDPAYPSQRVAYMIDDAQMKILLTEQSLLAEFDGGSARVVVLDADADADLLRQQPTTAPEIVVNSDSLAYVIYTSGSTGNPKGVQISHRALTNFLCSMQKEPGLSAADTLVTVTTVSFDIAALELYLPLINGARLVIVERETAADGPALAKVLDETQATVMQATPATWRLLLDSGWTGHAALKMLCGGEALPADLAQQLLPKGSELWNMYGPTEATIWSAVHKVSAGEQAISIGRPIANTEIYLLDEALQPVPTGTVGALYIGGDGLARGYLNRPELTAEKFIPHPFSDGTQQRIYETGDLARYLPDGRIECLGRNDSQVKLRGFRIELGEIEAALAAYPAMTQNAVILREDAPDDKRLVGYHTTTAGSELSISELREFLYTKLPEYMVPSQFVQLDKLPLTPNGKIDRKALPIPDTDRPELGNEFVAPQTPLETEIAAIWQSVMGLERIGTHDNFFDLGGHSLQATRIMARIRESQQIELSLRTLFEAPTVHGLSTKLMEMQLGEEDEADLLGMIEELKGISDDELATLLAE